ncbi:transporter [Streptomyces hygroscopicus subsp. sporocinereus]|uniref:Transporter n=1 Tax=Streptomyces hygroscopicus TaxID=1912 RepID=A0ABQ3TX26_STRHY|nr:MFS transporter [Streptomyces hygroscopicus]GHJ27887.1 transporter [Streptomyces hygroscopicus]
MLRFLASRPVVRRPGAAPARPRRRSPLAPYRRLFAAPGALAFTLAAFVGRLPGSMLGVSTVLLIATVRDSYALAGAVSATGVAVTAVAGPLLGRLVDRYGQARVAVPAVVCYVAGATAMVLCVHLGAPAWTLFCCAAGSSGVPSLGSMTRARWAALYRDDPAARHTANSFEQVVDELCFMAGPALAMVLCTTVLPEAGLITAAALLFTGTLLFAAQRRTEPPPGPRPARGRALLTPGLRVILTTFLATGAVFGSMEVATVAAVESFGHSTASSAVLALQAAGSCAAGLVFGALPPRGTAGGRLVTGVAAMALAVLPLLAAHSLATLAPLLFLAGMATAPTMITGMTLVHRQIPAARLNEGMTTVYTGLLIGISTGAAAGGWTVDHLGATSAYLTPVTAAAVAFAIAWAGRSRLRVPPPSA